MANVLIDLIGNEAVGIVHGLREVESNQDKEDILEKNKQTYNARIAECYDDILDPNKPCFTSSHVQLKDGKYYPKINTSSVTNWCSS